MSGGPDPRRRRPLAVSMGDPAGIGPEITLRAWLERSDRGLGPFVVFGDRQVFAERARLWASPFRSRMSTLPARPSSFSAAPFPCCTARCRHT